MRQIFWRTIILLLLCSSQSIAAAKFIQTNRKNGDIVCYSQLTKKERARASKQKINLGINSKFIVINKKLFTLKSSRQAIRQLPRKAQRLRLSRKVTSALKSGSCITPRSDSRPTRTPTPTQTSTSLIDNTPTPTPSTTETPSPSPSPTITPTPTQSLPIVQSVHSDNFLDYFCVGAEHYRSIIKAAPNIGGASESERLLKQEKQLIRDLNVSAVRMSLPDIRPSDTSSYHNIWWDRISQYLIDLSNPDKDGAMSNRPVSIISIDDNKVMGGWDESSDPASACYKPKMEALLFGKPVSGSCGSVIAKQAPRPAPVKLGLYGASNEPGHMFSMEYNDLKNIKCKDSAFVAANTQLCSCISQSLDSLGGYTCKHPGWPKAIKDRALAIKNFSMTNMHPLFQFTTLSPHYPTISLFSDYFVVNGNPIHKTQYNSTTESTPDTLYNFLNSAAEEVSMGSGHFYDFSRSIYWGVQTANNPLMAMKSINQNRLINVSEYGYHTLNRPNQSGAVSENDQANLLLRGSLTFFQKSVYSSNPNPEILQACVFALIDNPARLVLPKSSWISSFDAKEESFGLVRLERNADNTPKLPITYTPRLSYNAFKNFNNKLSDLKGSLENVAPLHAILTIIDSPDPAQHVWFAKSDGTYILAIWNEKKMPSTFGSITGRANLKLERKADIKKYNPFTNKTSSVGIGLSSAELDFSDWVSLYEISNIRK